MTGPGDDTPPPAALVAPVLRYRTPGICGHGPGPCGAEGARIYACGWRCPQHTPARLAGRAEPQPGPGWPAAAWSAPSPLGTSRVHDTRAITSGKRRSTPRTYRAAQADTRREER